jgi:REP element-mobilizing transposase RayT
MHHRLYLHLAWTTRDRAPLLDATRAQFLCRYLRGAARHHRSYVLEIGMVTTHVHLLTRVHPTTVLSRLLQSLKGGSATIVNRDLPPGPAPLHWAVGYSASSVGASGLDQVRTYLRAQGDHHPAERISGWGGDTPEYDREG